MHSRLDNAVTRGEGKGQISGQSAQQGRAQGNAHDRAEYRAQGNAQDRADLMTGRHRAAPALARSSGGSSVHKSLRGRHSR